MKWSWGPVAASMAQGGLVLLTVVLIAELVARGEHIALTMGALMSVAGTLAYAALGLRELRARMAKLESGAPVPRNDGNAVS